MLQRTVCAVTRLCLCVPWKVTVGMVSEVVSVAVADGRESAGPKVETIAKVVLQRSMLAK